jgi:hypothetical protein
MTAEAVVQRQLDAYNEHDLDALMAVYAPDAEQFEHPDKLLARGTHDIRARFANRFQEPNLHATLLKLVAIYEVRGELISRAWFIFGAKTLDAK